MHWCPLPFQKRSSKQAWNPQWYFVLYLKKCPWNDDKKKPAKMTFSDLCVWLQLMDRNEYYPSTNQWIVPWVSWMRPHSISHPGNDPLHIGASRYSQTYKLLLPCDNLTAMKCLTKINTGRQKNNYCIQRSQPIIFKNSRRVVIIHTYRTKLTFDIF